MNITAMNILKQIYRLVGPKNPCGTHQFRTFKIEVAYVPSKGHEVTFLDATDVPVFRGIYSNIIDDKILSVDILWTEIVPPMVAILINEARAAEKARLEQRLKEIEAEEWISLPTQ